MLESYHVKIKQYLKIWLGYGTILLAHLCNNCPRDEAIFTISQFFCQKVKEFAFHSFRLFSFLSFSVIIMKFAILVKRSSRLKALGKAACIATIHGFRSLQVQCLTHIRRQWRYLTELLTLRHWKNSFSCSSALGHL